MDSVPLWIGIVVALALAAAALAARIGPSRRLGLLAAALVLAPILVLAQNWKSSQIVDLRNSPAELAAALVLGVLVLAALVLAVRSRPRWLPVALLAALPFRIPLDLGGSTANLLVPLYALLAAGVIAALLEPDRVLPELGPALPSPPDLRRWIALGLAIVLVLYGLQTAYTDDLGSAVNNVGFFFVPFAALYVLLAGARWDRELLRALVVVLGALALLVALVAFGQYATGKLFWNDKVIAGNEAHAYFRVNSLFYDPNIMGRFLDIALIVLAGVVAWGRRREASLAAASFIAVLLALMITFSQSSMLALIAGMLVVAACRWGLGRGVGVGVVVLIAMAIATFAIEGGGLTAETTGRTGLISGGLHMFEDRPIEGYGAGSFGDVFAARYGVVDTGYAVESHTEPVTVLAEQGVVGFVPYLALLAVAVAGLWSAAGLGLRPARDPIAATLLAAFTVMVVHSMGYAAFFTDPLTWAILALAVALPEAIGARAPARLPAEPAARVPAGPA